MNIIDLIILVLLILSSVNGLRQGLIYALANLIGWILALILAIRYSDQIQPFMAILTQDVMIQKIAAFVAIILFVIFLTWIVGYFLHQIFKKLKLSWLNRLAGSAFGFFKSIVVFLVLIYTLDPWFAESKMWKTSKMIAILHPYAADATHYSKEIVQKTTEEIEQLNSKNNNSEQGDIISTDSIRSDTHQTENPFR